MHFLTIIKQHLYTICESPLSNQCVCGVYACPYVHTCGTCMRLRSSDHFSQRYIFCLHTWYDMYDELYMVCLCGGAQGQEGFRTKQRTPDKIHIYIWMLMYLPVQVHVRIPFHFLREKLQCYLIRVFVFRTVARGIFVCISPYRKHATTAAVAIGDATSTRAVVNLRCIMEYGYEYAYYFFGSSTYLGMRVPGTWYQVHFSSYKYFVPRKKKTLTTQQDQQH